MNYALTEEQSSVLSGLERLIEARAPAAPTQARTLYWASDLDAAIAEAGYLQIATHEGFGPLDAALVTERLARLPWLVETAISSLIAPALGLDPAARPFALVAADVHRPARFLPVARTLIVDRGRDVLVVPVSAQNVEPIETLMAYPYGRLKSLELAGSRVVDDGESLRRRWRIGLAAEAAGCLAAALAQVVEHVKTRRAFGRPLGAFQSIQHRLAQTAETAEAAKYLTFRAAWSDTALDAALAATFVQSRIAQVTYDLHQFSGAMGLTLEYPLHLWTYRLRALLGELGGASVQSMLAARCAWGAAG
jgi:alkylation response protein AidB-like acyl-CoA dehydrogenase